MISEQVEHQPERQRFIVHSEGQESVLQYRLEETEDGGSGTVDFTRTYVPPELRGQGIAEALVRRGLSWAKEHDYDIEASCWYVSKFLR